jgi:hypothetical protein
VTIACSVFMLGFAFQIAYPQWHTPRLAGVYCHSYIDQVKTKKQPTLLAHGQLVAEVQSNTTSAKYHFTVVCYCTLKGIRFMNGHGIQKYSSPLIQVNRAVATGYQVA